jgi:nucleotide-binding universal stress UspA family protein
MNLEPGWGLLGCIWKRQAKMSIFPTKILLAIDGSKEASLAAQTAVDIAEKISSELYVVHVWESLPLLASSYGAFGYTDAQSIQTMVEQAEREARKMLDEQVEHIRDTGGTVRESYLRQGYPDQEIVALAEEIDVGLIVMGSRGLGGMRRALLGSVSDSVVRHAHCPVLVVRKEEREKK